MSDMSGGQIVGGIIGAVVGFYMGAPVQGFAVGAGIGGYIDPPKGPNFRGPELNDKSYQSTAYGVSNPDLYGTIGGMGNVIYLENNEYRAQTKKNSGGGKGGGGSTQETTVYSATFAVSLSRARPNTSVRRIWAGGKLIYSAGSADLGSIVKRRTLYEVMTGVEKTNIFNFYDGTQTEPDSRMEAVLGVGNCPSYEGTAYIIFNDFELTDYGNGLAGCPMKVEIAPNDSAIIPPFSDKKKIYENSHPYGPAFIFEKSTGTDRANLPVIRYILEAEAGGILRANPGFDPKAIITGFRIKNGNLKYSSMDGIDASEFSCPGINDSRGIPRGISDIDSAANQPAHYAQYVEGYQARGSIDLLFGQGGLWQSGPAYEFEGTESANTVAIGATEQGLLFYVYTSTRIIAFNSEFEIVSEHVFGSIGSNTVKMWWFKNALYVASVSASIGWVFDVYDFELNQIGAFILPPTNSTMVEYYFSIDEQGVIWRCWSTHPTFGSEPAAIHMDAWLVNGVGDDLVSVGPALLEDICMDILQDCGIKPEHIDLSELDGIYVDGYRTEVGSGRAKLDPLKAAFFFDLIESGYKIKAILRNVPSSGTIPHQHLMLDGDSIVKTEIVTPSDLPSEYSLSFIDYSREYDANVERAIYPSHYTNKRDEQLPIVMTANYAAKTVDRFINLAWAEATKYSFKLPQRYLGVKAGDVKQVEVRPGYFKYLQFDSLSVGQDQVITVSARSTDPSAYDSNASGSDGSAIPDESVDFQFGSMPLIADIPLVYDAYNSFGVAAAVYTDVSYGSFRGSVLQLSRNSGQIYESLETFPGVGTIGQASGAANTNDCAVIDRISVINVNVFCGTFYSVTEEQMMQGMNYCAYGVDGRWEIIRYANAALQPNGSVTLSVLLRGLHGTEWASGLHQTGDFLMLLTDIDNRFISVDPALLGVPVIYRSVNIGDQYNTPETIEQTYRGVNLRPLSPVNPKYSMYADQINLSWSVRTRMKSNQWTTGVEAPIGESTLQFAVEVYSSADQFIKVYLVSAAEFIYTPQMQEDDFGILPAIIVFKISQISAAVGRGYALTVTADVNRDQYIANNRLLMHFDGADESTVFTDSSASARVFTTFGNAKIDDPGYFNQCGVFDGSGDYLSSSSVSNFGFGGGDFTIEFFLNFTVVPFAGADATAYASIISQRATSTTNNQFTVFYGATEKIYFAYSLNGTAQFQLQWNSQPAAVAGVWRHIAICRKGNAVTLFINGVSQGSQSLSGSLFASTSPILIGAANAPGLTYYLNGKVDELRIKLGVAIYTANFPVPVAPFPNS